MTEMTRRERILTASRGERADKLPFFHWWRHSQIGWAERECRNRGMGMAWARPSYTVELRDVDVVEQPVVVEGVKVLRRTYNTPMGSIYLDEKREPGTGEWHGMRSWQDVSPWQTERLIKQPEDYEVLKFIVEHTVYTADYFPIEQAKDWLGEDGCVVDIHPHSPMQMLMIDWIGSEGGRFFIHYAKYHDLVEDLYRAISKSREPMYEISARSPADVIWCGDNIDGVLVNPRLFEQYFMPEYEKMAKPIHRQGKLFASHMDGRVDVLKDLIAQTPLDIVEGLHPPPMGDLPIGEALSLWKDKVVWMGFAGSVYTLGPEATKKHTLELLREVLPGDRLTIAMSTENLVSNENLRMVTSVLENVDLPLTGEKIGVIEKSLG
ncbi:MAG: hypothetical protein QF906_04090 [Dehalococcoidales bacterium]|nr:hypothetical protein [Dehalococcoidales bacterium]MDP6043159.1 hypothetical protein [Dehalococcoidales bacterium]MDP6576377.1 hypothetical protein [Dehalococcoidales bacterium]MDP7285662.1 hypothetical protein [Dehalococcoidales bacterium]MDP7416009.1 hypothetical protein [Dehalococcoidales bacterium]